MRLLQFPTTPSIAVVKVIKTNEKSTNLHCNDSAMRVLFLDITTRLGHRRMVQAMHMRTRVSSFELTMRLQISCCLEKRPTKMNKKAFWIREFAFTITARFGHLRMAELMRTLKAHSMLWDGNLMLFWRNDTFRDSPPQVSIGALVADPWGFFNFQPHLQVQ